MLERRSAVEGHPVRSVQPPQAFEILRLDSFHDLVNLLPGLGFVFLALRGHRYPSPSDRCGILASTRKTKQLPRMSDPQPRGGACGPGCRRARPPPAAFRDSTSA